MTGPEHVMGLFTRLSQDGGGLIGLADRLIAWAAVAERPRLGLGFVAPSDDTGSDVVVEIADDTNRLRTPDRSVTRLVRPLLARLAMMGHEETGAEFGPYGGVLALERHPATGPVRLDIEFGNSQATGFYLRIARTPLPPADLGHVNGVAQPASVHPVAG